MEFIFPITMGGTVLLLLVLGIMVKHYKAYWLMSGYNTMSKAQKEKVDVESLAKFVGNMMFVMAAIFLAGTLLITFGQGLLGGIIFVAIVPLTLYMTIKSQKYDGNSRNPDGTMTTKTKWLIGGITALLTITAVGIGTLLYFSNQPTEVVLEKDSIQIKGLYGETIPVSEITELYLKEDLPTITYKNHGSALGSKKKGHFTLKDLGSAKLFVDTSKPPFIYFKKGERLFVLNCSNASETKDLFQRLSAQWNALK